MIEFCCSHCQHLNIFENVEFVEGQFADPSEGIEEPRLEGWVDETCGKCGKHFDYDNTLDQLKWEYGKQFIPKGA